MENKKPQKVRTIADIEKELAEARQKAVDEANKKRQNYESIRETTVKGLCSKALELSKSIKSFKNEAFNDMNTLAEILREYSERHASGKGNFRIQFGDFRVNYKKQGKPTFDERSHIAEGFIKDFIASKFQEDPDTFDLINSLLERKNGEFDINLIQKLYKMESRFDNENWKKGIELMKESYSYEFSKDYITFEEKNSNGEWVNIPLNFSSI